MIDKARLKAVAFDYGNTLVEFARPIVRAFDTALGEALSRLYGPPDMAKLQAIRDRNRMAPYSGNPPEYRENDLHEITAELVVGVYGVEASKTELDILTQARFDAFVELVDMPECVLELLERLGAKYRLGLLSNYPDGDAIRASLAKTGLDKYLNAVVVSGDVGFVKPHPLPFEILTDALGAGPGEILFVGDNWLADIQGAKRAGMMAAHMCQWAPPESFDKQPGDFEPDFTIRHVGEIEDYV